MKSILYSILTLFFLQSHSQDQAYFMEKLDRGLIAIPTPDDSVLVSWRWLASDPQGTTFDVYRNGKKINVWSLDERTNLKDEFVSGARYNVVGKALGHEASYSDTVEIWENNFLKVPLNQPTAGSDYSYEPNDASVADLDNDGQYEIVLKWNPTNAKDNSQSGFTGNVYLDAYELDGTQLWRVDLGRNIRAGAHYTQFLVYDFESDGLPELVCRTSDGTKDSKGTVIGDPNADHRNDQGYVLEGPEFLTVFDGLTGEIMAMANYLPERGNVNDWGDGYGNRVDRFLAGVGYFDGERPSILMTRGYYTRSVLVAWDYRDGKLSHRWTFDTDDGHQDYSGKGNHNLSVADVDNDGKDEVIFGAIAIDDDGAPLHKVTWGHGDALHVSDFDPDRPGLEIFMPVEWASGNPSNQRPGLTFRDGISGELIWGAYPAGEDVDVGRGVCSDITSISPGAESWGSKGLGLYNTLGEHIGDLPGSVNFLVWWDGDLTRELLSGNTITKYGEGILLEAIGATSNNGTKATPTLSADIFGDWREEVILREENNQNLRIYSTPIPSDHRLITLMHNRQYRESIAWQNVGYNQPPHTSYFLGDGMSDPEIPNVKFPPSPGKEKEVLKINNRSEGMLIYPNPTKDGVFRIKFPDKGIKDPYYKLFDLQGKQLTEGSLTEQLALPGLASGLYLIKILEGNKLVSSQRLYISIGD